MTILLITPLFPDSLKTSRTNTTFAIYNFVKYWRGSHRIIVIRPKKSSIRNFIKLKAVRLIMEGIEIIDVPYFRSSLLSIDFLHFFARRCIKELKRQNAHPDIVLAHYHLSIHAGSIIASILKIPFVAAIHKRDIVNLEDGNFSQYKRSLKGARLVIFRSEAIGRRFNTFISNLKCPTYIANSGIEASEIIDSEAFIKKYTRISTTKQLKLITVANLISRKGVDAVLKALPSLERDFTYKIVGDGPDRERLVRLCDELGLSDRVCFTGAVDRNQVLSEMESADIFVMVSEKETFGLVYVEALAKGCLLIGSRGWGIDGIIIDGKNGFLADPCDEHTLGNVLRKVGKMNTSDLEKMADTANKTILALEEEKVALDYLSELKKLCN